MLTDPGSLTPDARRTANRLLDALQAATDSSALEPCEVGDRSALVERAKGALMLHYGVDSHQAFAVLVGWARMTRTPVPTIAHTLLRGICEGDPETDVRHRPLIRWLEAQLRNGDPGHAQIRTDPADCQPAHDPPRSS